MISDEEYERVKKFWNFLSLRKLSDLNDLYNFQGTIIICKIFENRVEEMIKILPLQSAKMYVGKFSESLHSSSFLQSGHFAQKHKLNLRRCFREHLSVASILAWHLTRKFFFQKTRTASERKNAWHLTRKFFFQKTRTASKRKNLSLFISSGI